MQSADIWNKLSTSSSGIVCYSGMGRLPSAKGEGVVPFPPRAVHIMLTQIARRGEFDSQFERGGSIEKLDARVCVLVGW